MIYVRYFEAQEDGPTYLDMRTKYGYYGYDSEFSFNPIGTYSLLNAKDVLFSFDNNFRWLILLDVTSFDFNWMWNSGKGYEYKTFNAKTSLGQLYSGLYFKHWTTEIYQIGTSPTWDTNVIMDLGFDTNHGAAFWDNANGIYKRLGNYQTKTNTWLRILIR